MKLLRHFLKKKEPSPLALYIVSLEKWIINHGGSNFLVQLREEYYTNRKAQEDTGKKSQSRK